jgi:hypothetical protein
MKERDQSSMKLKEQLDELVISYRKEVHDSEEKGLPYIEESGRIYRGARDIKEWLDELRTELNQQRSLSGDGCYINPENGKTC